MEPEMRRGNPRVTESVDYEPFDVEYTFSGGSKKATLKSDHCVVERDKLSLETG
jgi:hypothetical protein